MKRILCIAMLLPALAFAQVKDSTTVNTKNPYTISVNLSAAVPGQLGLSLERRSYKHGGGISSNIYNLSIGAMEIKSFRKFTGTGFVIEAGSRQYFKKEKWSAFYFENTLAYGNISFDEPVIFNVQDGFQGTYSYFSLINPSIGYKFDLGRFCIDPSLGMNWKWQIAGKGDVDNKDIANLDFELGVKIGYRF